MFGRRNGLQIPRRNTGQSVLQHGLAPGRADFLKMAQDMSHSGCYHPVTELYVRVMLPASPGLFWGEGNITPEL